MRRFNLLAPEFDHSSERDGFRWQAARVGQAIGSEEIGARLFELAEGERSFPYHFHHVTEEWLYVVAGSPGVRTPGGERVLAPGDVLCFPAGAAGAHQVTGPGTILLLSSKPELDVVEYPDSGKIGVRPSGQNFRNADAVDYWDGE
jgi:uncharacterized cupin superfamily protein